MSVPEAQAPLDQPLAKTAVFTSSVAASTQSPLPKSEDAEDPLHWTKGKRWRNITCAAALNFLDTIGSSAIATAVPSIIDELASDTGKRTAVTLVVSIYVLGIVVGPLVVAPLSERYGRLCFYLGSNLLFVIFNIACGLSNSLTMLICFRVFTGCASATPPALGAGTIADLTDPNDRTYSTAVWASCAVIGPILGPIVGGLITSAGGWRWVFWTMAIAGAVVLVPCVLFMRETHKPTILRRNGHVARGVNTKQESGHDTRLQESSPATSSVAAVCLRPLHMLCTDWMLLLLSVYSALADAYLFIVLATFAEVYITKYGFSMATTGLAYLGMAFGAIFGHILHTVLSDKTVREHQAKGDYRPEWRLFWMPIGSITMPLGLFWYGWCVEKRVHWIASIIGMFPCGMGMVIIMVPPLVYLIDAYTEYAASAVAAMVVTRAVAGAFIPLAAYPLYDSLGYGWGNSLLALIGLVLAPIPFALFHYGERIRLHTQKRHGKTQPHAASDGISKVDKKEGGENRAAVSRTEEDSSAEIKTS